MSSTDNYYSTTKGFNEYQKEIKEDIIKYKQCNTNITTESIKLEKQINEFKSKVFNYKESYLAKDSKVYNANITERENIMRINYLESFMTECDKFIDEVDKIRNSKFKIVYS